MATEQGGEVVAATVQGVGAGVCNGAGQGWRRRRRHGLDAQGWRRRRRHGLDAQGRRRLRFPWRRFPAAARVPAGSPAMAASVPARQGKALIPCNFYQSIGSLQKKYSVGAFELLSKTAPIQAISLLVLGPFTDYYLSGNLISDYIKNVSSGAIVFILLSCSLAVFCNISQYLCIGRFSAVSFQVLGHMKTVCVLTLGWLLFESQLTLKNILGMLVAVAGMIIYSWAVEAEKASSKITTHTKHSLTEEELNLLKEGLENIPIKDYELGESK